MEITKKYSYIPTGVCCQEIEIELSGDRVARIEFIKGCDGNTHGIENLTKGMLVSEVIGKLKGIDCKGRGTSCPDQLSKALESATSK